MLYHVEHTTTYLYTEAILLSHHLLRLHPRALSRQHCLHHELDIDPRPSLVHSHLDYFGNRVHFATLTGSHRQLVVTSRSKVRLCAPAEPDPGETPAWEDVRDSCRGEQIGASLEASEYLFSSSLIRTAPVFVEYAAASFTRNRPILEAVRHLSRRIHRDFKYDPRSTTIATPLEEVLRTRRGVCQDFAHFQIACLRSLGLPARYVSGYLETDPPPNQPRLQGADASHAWISFYSPGIGWIDVDPTNNLLPGTRHITVAWGRDYSDVSPIRGVILGSGGHTLKVAVDVTLAG